MEAFADATHQQLAKMLADDDTLREKVANSLLTVQGAWNANDMMEKLTLMAADPAVDQTLVGEAVRVVEVAIVAHKGLLDGMMASAPPFDTPTAVQDVFSAATNNAFTVEALLHTSVADTALMWTRSATALKEDIDLSPVDNVKKIVQLFQDGTKEQQQTFLDSFTQFHSAYFTQDSATEAFKTAVMTTMDVEGRTVVAQALNDSVWGVDEDYIDDMLSFLSAHGDHPPFDALKDIKALQEMRADYLEGGDRPQNPPLFRFGSH